MMAESLDTSELVPDEDDRKLFVGGLPQVIHCCHLLEFLHSRHWHSLQDARQEDISAHFQTFGEIDNINIKTDPATGRSRWDWIITTFIKQVTELHLCCRGFAFVVFKTISSLQDAVNEQEHSVKGKKVAVKKAKAKEGKIYVGKLKPELSDEEIKNHFAQFGNISQVRKLFAWLMNTS